MDERTRLQQAPSPAEQAGWLPQVAAGVDAEKAMAALFRHYDKGIRGYLSKRFRLDEQEAKDAWQDALIKLWQNAHRYRSERPLHPWVVTYASNQARNLLNEAWNRHRTGLSAFESGDADADDPDAQDAVTDAGAGVAIPAAIDPLAEAALVQAAGIAEADDEPAAGSRAYRDLRGAECGERGMAKFELVHPEDARWLFGFELEGRSKASLAAEKGCSTYFFEKLLAELREKLEPFIRHCYDLLETG